MNKNAVKNLVYCIDMHASINKYPYLYLNVVVIWGGKKTLLTKILDIKVERKCFNYCVCVLIVFHIISEI